jgi:hypothetical protein
MALTGVTKPIPGIPLAALDAVQDTKVRDVLRALVATHNVRNNLVGGGDDAFITSRQAAQIVRIGNPNDPLAAPRLLARYAHGDGGGPYGPGTLSDALGTVSLVLDRTTHLRVIVNWVVSGIVVGDSRGEVRTGTGAVVLSQSCTAPGSKRRTHVASAGLRLDAGEHTLSFHSGNDGKGLVQLEQWGMLVMPVAG